MLPCCAPRSPLRAVAAMTRAPAVDREVGAPRSWTPRPVHLWWVLIGAVALVGAFFLAPLLRVPGHVDGVSFENPTGYDITIEASDGRDGAWTPVGTVDAGETTSFDRVYDQGGERVFRFSSQGRDAGELARTRAQLEDADWQVAIPPSVASALQADGAPEPG